MVSVKEHPELQHNNGRPHIGTRPVIFPVDDRRTSLLFRHYLLLSSLLSARLRSGQQISWTAQYNGRREQTARMIYWGLTAVADFPFSSRSLLVVSEVVLLAWCSPVRPRASLIVSLEEAAVRISSISCSSSSSNHSSAEGIAYTQSLQIGTFCKQFLFFFSQMKTNYY